MTMNNLSQEIRECIQNCLDCYKVCLENVIYSPKGAEHMLPSHTRLLLECANICNTSANFMILGSEFHSQTCHVCAQICERCAEMCGRFDDSQMKTCASVCRKCAKSCAGMDGVVAHAA